jgi:hypothetical protein
MSCSVALCLAWDPHSARGACVGETLALQMEKDFDGITTIDMLFPTSN